MAAYVLPDAVRQILAPDGDSSRDTATAASMSDDELNVAIGDAGAQVDTALGERYSVPFASPFPAVIVGLTRDIAAYLATLTWRKGGNLGPEHPLVLRYARAVAMLAALSAGTATITPPADSSNAVVVNIVPWGSTYYPGFWPGEGVTQ